MRAMRLVPIVMLITAAWTAAGCGSGSGDPGPSDDPDDYPVDPGRQYDVTAPEPRWVVPSEGLPERVAPDLSNNNLDLRFFDGRLFLAWRTAPFHFASTETRMVVVSSVDEGHTWEFENEIAIGADMREPRLLAIGGRLHLLYFEAGTDMFGFEPKRIWRSTRSGPGAWEEPVVALDEPEVPWDLKVRRGRAWLTSYRGGHYVPGESNLELYFKESDDGISFSKVGGRGYVYRGGVSEAAFEFDAEGNLWAVTRNEDGDGTGFGSHVCFAPAADLSAWECSPESDPERYDSPEMFRHNDEIYLIARRDIGGPYDAGRDDLSFSEQKTAYLMSYSLRPKGSALYRVDRDLRKVVKLIDLPGCGDNAFPAVVRLDADRFLLANYTNPLDMTDATWLAGQTSQRGTQIYLLTLTFSPVR